MLPSPPPLLAIFSYKKPTLCCSTAQSLFVSDYTLYASITLNTGAKKNTFLKVKNNHDHRHSHLIVLRKQCNLCHKMEREITDDCQHETFFFHWRNWGDTYLLVHLDGNCGHSGVISILRMTQMRTIFPTNKGQSTQSTVRYCEVATSASANKMSHDWKLFQKVKKSGLAVLVCVVLKAPSMYKCHFLYELLLYVNCLA